MSKIAKKWPKNVKCRFFIKSVKVIHEYEAVSISFSKKIVSKSFKVIQSKKMRLIAKKGQIFIKSIEN